MEKYTEQEQIRRNSLKELISLGINPYPAEEFKINTNSEKIKDGFLEDKNNFQNVLLAGRIMSRRIMGKAAFVELKDFEGRIQLYFNRDEVCPGDYKTMYNVVFKNLIESFLLKIF